MFSPRRVIDVYKLVPKVRRVDFDLVNSIQVTDRALLQEELASLFAHAPVNPTVSASTRVQDALKKAEGKSTEIESGKERRVPGEDDDCPICCKTVYFQFIPNSLQMKRWVAKIMLQS